MQYYYYHYHSAHRVLLEVYRKATVVDLCKLFRSTFEQSLWEMVLYKCVIINIIIIQGDAFYSKPDVIVFKVILCLHIVLCLHVCERNREVDYSTLGS